MNPCIEWEGRRTPGGYGVGPGGFAHRVAYQRAQGPIPKGFQVCHRCDNRGCVNPEHLFLGTAKDNYEDCRRKGRTCLPPVMRGAANPRAVLTPESVAEIRSVVRSALRARRAVGFVRLRRGDGTIRTLAKRFGVSVAAVYFAAKGVTW